MALRDLWEPDNQHGRRFGHLVPVPVAPGNTEGMQVRCACERCGAHLLATAVGDGSLAGACAVCLSQQFRPVKPVPH